jgi:hypothetical protein
MLSRKFEASFLKKPYFYPKIDEMFQIGDKIVSSELLDEEFHCHLELCHGNCCVFGDSGAPLEEGETNSLEKYYPQISKYITRAGRAAIEEQGTWVDDSDGDRVTPLIEGKECAYTFFVDGVAFCGIEKAWENEEIPFRKPLSCHLYPIRIRKVGRMTALNYHRWPICNPARSLGKHMGIPVFRFLKEALIRAYGIDFYDELEKVYKEWRKP